eukprot:gene12324-14267_t
MGDSTVIELPKGLKHWINSVKTASCTLFNSLEDLRDGHCIRELVEHLFHCKIAVDERTPAGLIQGSLNTIAEHIGWKNIPPEFKTPQAAFRLSQKGQEKVFICAFVQFLHDLALQQAPEAQHLSNLDAEMAQTMDEMRSTIQQEVQQATAVQSERSQLYADDLAEQPLSYEDYLSLADFDKDSLQGTEEELNVLKSAEFRHKRLHGTMKGGRKVSTKPTLSRSGSNTGGALILKQKISSAPLRPVSQANAPVVKPAPVTAPVPLVTRRTTKPITHTTTSAISSTATGTSKSLATPAGVKIHNSGLHMSTLHDPTYKPKKSNLFTPTIVPEVVIPVESSDSEDSIQPNYDYTNNTTTRTGSISVNSRNRRIPHSRSISPVGRRHIHCTLDSVQNSMQHGVQNGQHMHTRSVSPNEARLSRYYPYQQAYDPAVINAPPLAPANVPASQNPNVPLKPNKLGENPIKTKQMQAVAGVFKRNDPQQRPPAIFNIDDVISIERKNVILLWVQKQLGITVDVFVNSATSNHYNKTAGKNVVNPDTIAVIPHKHNAIHNHTNQVSATNTTSNNVYTASNNTHAAYSVQQKANKENYTFYPHPEDAYFSAGRSAYMHGTFSIATYLGRVTNAVPEYSGAISERLLSQEKILQIPEDFVDRVGFSVPPQVRTPCTSIGVLNDPWVNGMLLSEILACLSGENRALIKQVESYDRFGKLLSPPKLIVAGTEHNVRSKAQATHNLQLCMDFLSTTIPLFPVLDYSASDIVNGEVSLWALLSVVYELCKNKKTNNSSGGSTSSNRSGSNGRGRSVSPGLRAKSPIRSISAPLESRHTNTNNQSVSFAADSLGTHIHSNRYGSNSTTGNNANNNSTNGNNNMEHTGKSTRPTNITKSRSRSTSPNSVHSAGTAASSNNNIDANAASMLEHRRQERENERIRAREYMQRKRQSGTNTGSTESNTSETSEKVEKGWVSSTVVEKPRSASVNTRRASIATNATTSSNNAAEGVSGANSNVNSTSTAATATSSVGTSKPSTQAHLTIPSKHWLPPKLSQTEIEAARNTFLPTITIFQMRTIRDWLRNAFDITLLDAECGFSNMGMLNNISGGYNIPSSGDKAAAIDTKGDTNNATSANRKADVRFEPRYEPTSVTTPPPLPLQSDRLRNGVVLGQLLMRLEPNAAIHAHIPRLLHKHPRSLELCLENIERVLWVFKLRRSPPLPYHYLCLSEEILQGNEKVIWGLLWELMQAYPYAALQGGNKTHPNTTTKTNNTYNNSNKPQHTIPSNFDSYHENTNNLGVLNANPDILLPQPGNGPLKHSRNSTRSSIKPTQNVFGLKGAEAKHNVPSYNRYNLSHPELENPVPLHTLPYSDVQRHLLDKSLLAWLEETNVLYNIVGTLGRPVTILALESYCRDGTLFCMLLTEVLKLDLSKEYTRQPTTYTECISNIKLCTEVLRKCQTMRGRYLYGGVEEHICSGRWDSILGLLEDMHRYSDGVHPHAQLFSTVDSSGYAAGSGEAGDVGAFDLTTVDVPYLGKYGTKIGSTDNHDSDIREDGVQGPSNSSYANIGATTVNRGYPTRPMSNSQGPDLLHDVEYAFDPQLNLHPVDITPNLQNTTNASVHVTPSLDQQVNPLPLHPHSNINRGGQSEDLFPSNVVGGANVVNLLKQQNNKNNTANGSHHTNRSFSSAVNTTTPNNVPTWVVKDHSPVALSQALCLNDSDTDARTGYSSAEGARRPGSAHSRSVSPVPTRTSAASAEGKNGGNKQHTPVHLRSALKTPTSERISPTRRAPHAAVSARRGTPYSSSHAANTSVYSSDSLDYPSSLESTPERDLANKSGEYPDQYSKIGINGMSASPERSPSARIEPAKFRRLTKWLDKIGVNVPRRSERSFVSRDIFADGVYLCQILQKLERSAALPGTFAQPRVQSERVQNVRRCLEFLATRHKNIPLRALSCEDDVLEGDLVRTVELLFAIKKAYANHRL